MGSTEELEQNAEQNQSEDPQSEDRPSVEQIAQVRARARAAEQDNLALQQQITGLQQQLDQAKQPPQAAPAEGNEDIDFPTLNDIEKILDKRDAKAKADQEAERQKTLQKKAQESVTRAGVDYSSEELINAGLDFISVFAAGNKNLTDGDRFDIASAGENAGKLMYERCIERTPELRQKRATHKPKEPGPDPPPKGPGPQEEQGGPEPVETDPYDKAMADLADHLS
jgi:hypothetical protein